MIFVNYEELVLSDREKRLVMGGICSILYHVNSNSIHHNIGIMAEISIKNGLNIAL